MSGEEYEALDRHIRELVADWPPFTPEQEARLWLLFHSGPQPAASADDDRQQAA